LAKRMIIGVAGKKRSGKDTLCGFLKEFHPFERIAFAGPLWEILLETDPWVQTDDGFMRLTLLNELYGYEHCKTHFPDVREYMKKLGTEGAREHISQTVWLDIAKNRMLANPDQSFLISDVRFDNEAAMIQRLGGIVLKLDREMEGEEDTHPSENIEQVMADLNLLNNGDLDDLRHMAKGIVDNYHNIGRK
jgi:hypothetical protein